MAKNTPKAPAESADAPTTDAIAPAPAPDTTEASNASGTNDEVLDSIAADQAATEPAPDGAAQPTEAAPEVTDTAAPGEPDQPAVNQDPPPPLPKRIKLVSLYGFYDDTDQLRMWPGGYETTDIDEIELFVTRGVEFEFLE